MGNEPKPDVDARNRDFIRYEQVDKPQDYRLAEREGEERFAEDLRIRSCDLGLLRSDDPGDQERFASELGSALAEIGFAVLENTGFDPTLYPRIESEVLRLFTATSLPDKLRFRARRHGSINQGYFPIEQTSDIHPDLVEGWVLGRRAFEPGAGEQWPDPVAPVRFGELCRAHERLILPIMRAMLRFLGCDPHLYDERMRGTNYALRLNYYPPLRPADLEGGAGRLLGHEDVTMFTLLPAPTIEGLQVLDRRDFAWIRLAAPPGSLILNTGDYMQRISNDVLPSTTHRVSKPRDPAMQGRARATFPMNVYLWEDELLEILPCCGAPKYPPIRAIDFHTRTTRKYYGDAYAVMDTP